MFLMNQWYAAALPRELSSAPLARMICGKPIVMFRTASGIPAALDDRCPHRYAPLSAGSCAGETIACAYHGIAFGPDGACAGIPHQDVIPPRMRVRSYPLVERSGWAWIWLGDPALADPNTIPDYWWFANPKWHCFQRHYYIKAKWESCADNLLDLSHTPFIHKKTVGVPEMAIIPVTSEVIGSSLASIFKLDCACRALLALARKRSTNACRCLRWASCFLIIFWSSNTRSRRWRSKAE